MAGVEQPLTHLIPLLPASIAGLSSVLVWSKGKGPRNPPNGSIGLNANPIQAFIVIKILSLSPLKTTIVLTFVLLPTSDIS